MFSKETKKSGDKKIVERNIIGKNTKIIGDIISEGDFRLDGTLEGTIKTDGRVIIGNDGYIKGKVECANADIEGKFSGELIVSNTLSIKSNANITGDVVISKLSVEPGATFNATCSMKGGIKELKKDERKLQEKTA
ncbi:bactofilin family protein [Tenacibaculum maritimum]|uniref:bactofilin family protein n=1 Tax=Tenacibaculum maritimum TaxID=107401 RepID=UPI0010A4490C|nr:polymer-forming cytoskeletal protein [Tenacibaculum maritimum]MCD9562258.1 polymer-forming cytoskeletal protein [Tenacibaculum maritimum]MCD9564595.1 polymer-forming cytoskeletal protein [Tenacibaculum maritimum]MCD9578325.1 polymer-forming cytoskeletal protein [Tenacibaculum maritimum]MCD9584163.1 polymer-forming cytoskeletal protein [Tenacibaculum maritimum]MCD9595449.1 polymer-forming cytoskeletal protein [Tenacibaculum maritimum]